MHSLKSKGRSAQVRASSSSRPAHAVACPYGPSTSYSEPTWINSRRVATTASASGGDFPQHRGMPRPLPSAPFQASQYPLQLSAPLPSSALPGGARRALVTDTKQALGIETHLATLKRLQGQLLAAGALEHAQAVAAAEGLKETVAFAVNTKSPGVKSLQMAVTGSDGALDTIILLASKGYPVAFECLQILCYRNRVNCQTLSDRGIRKHIWLPFPLLLPLPFSFCRSSN